MAVLKAGPQTTGKETTNYMLTERKCWSDNEV